MQKKLLLTSLFVVICFSGCTRVKQTYNKYDQSHGYLKTDKYMAKRIVVPGDLNNVNIEDYYVVPTIANQGDPKVPSLRPPQDKVVVNNQTKQEDKV